MLAVVLSRARRVSAPSSNCTCCRSVDWHDRPERAAKAFPESSVNKIIWAQAGRVTEPGRYMFKFGWLTVTAEDLAVWKQYPNAAFTLLRTAPAEEGEDEFRLGIFELRENLSVSEK
jgi:hypothetical protein